MTIEETLSRICDEIIFIEDYLFGSTSLTENDPVLANTMDKLVNEDHIIQQLAGGNDNG